jgi:hypothetical protein
MRPLPSSARVGTFAGIHTQRTRHVQYIFTYIDVQTRCENGCACVVLHTLRSRARADDALIRGMCASAARSLRKAIDGTRRGIVYVHLMHACIYIYARLATPTNGSPMRARRTPTCCVRPRARVRVCDWACMYPRRHMRAPFRRRGPRVARLAGVRVGSSVQREHRRVEHRVGHNRVLCMRRLFGPGRRTTAAGRARRVVDAWRGSSMRGGAADTRAPARRRRVGTRMRGCPRV